MVQRWGGGIHMNRGRVGEERRGKETDGCPLTLPTKSGAQNSQYTLLNNKMVLHGVQQYLAAQGLGSIIPLQLCRHVNEVMIPMVNLSGKNSSISDWTGISWLKKVGYTCEDVKRGLHHDRHEQPDVVEA
jgi:hypothetical protein